MKIRDAIKAASNGVYISIEVTPNSKQSCVYGYNEWRKSIAVRVKAPPKGGKANAEIVELFSKIFRKKVEIVKGHTSSQKVIFVHSASPQEVESLLVKSLEK
ncbi:DUF167 domain-containing protein [Archaeoglobus veneficus]|uniref:UPF0235 protein Arcve_1935 n=1 Tax=Archaeoglobus veneficus (strain DSM 11195 / SNP6) TaxID=693661 RepID=F2KRR4_ARCVS|nr:DUF167 domain-containing protein [Archaeoglobus veneficus]AEA47928.1 UPF0235 protein yggU [Archaeoglobus veneficus SNP6]